jgi:hypothetical protein
MGETNWEMPMTVQHDKFTRGAAHDERLALPIEQVVLLWCMRMWVIGMQRGIPVETRIGEMLESLGAPATSPWLKQLMFSLSQGCTRMIEVRCVCHPQIGADERALLDVLSLAQAMRSFEALLVLRGFVTQTGATAALCGAEGVGASFAQAGLFLPEPEQAMRHFVITQAAAPGRFDSESLH